MPPRPAGLANSNIYSVAVAGNATVWDTAALNGWTGTNPDATSVKLPCYQAGSPVDGYLGGDMAYMMLAWSNGADCAWGGPEGRAWLLPSQERLCVLFRGDAWPVAAAAWANRGTVGAGEGEVGGPLQRMQGYLRTVLAKPWATQAAQQICQQIQQGWLLSSLLVLEPCSRAQVASLCLCCSRGQPGQLAARPERHLRAAGRILDRGPAPEPDAVAGKTRAACRPARLRLAAFAPAKPRLVLMMRDAWPSCLCAGALAREA